MPIIDAHQHLQDDRFGNVLPQVIREMQEVGIVHSVINGTSECDWSHVASLHTDWPSVLTPAFGLHPWKIVHRSCDWRSILADYLCRFPNSSIGECGLDRWKKDIDFQDQMLVFTQHLELAKELNRPITIHCLKAWGDMMGCLKRFSSLPPFLLHSYSGPVELIPALVRLGAYFSFSGYFLHERKKQARDHFAEIPIDRLLIESDAPDMAPPRVHQGRFHHPNFHHPADLPHTLKALADLRQMEEEKCAHACYTNAIRLFRLRITQPEQAQRIEHYNHRRAFVTENPERQRNRKT